ncbi:hypothetical protein B0H21DRAFT_159038 [Amylocystis lapponica]|nr:hypothetical protein B0H21DRAFT_159038 [Amylocystis lapponica]
MDTAHAGEGREVRVLTCLHLRTKRCAPRICLCLRDFVRMVPICRALLIEYILLTVLSPPISESYRPQLNVTLAEVARPPDCARALARTSKRARSASRNHVCTRRDKQPRTAATYTRSACTPPGARWIVGVVILHRVLLVLCQHRGMTGRPTFRDAAMKLVAESNFPVSGGVLDFVGAAESPGAPMIVSPRWRCIVAGHAHHEKIIAVVV